MSYMPTKADPDVWIRPATKPNVFEYYEKTPIYVDNILCISHAPHATMKGIQATFKLKYDKFEKPEIYLRAMLTQKIINGMEFRTVSSEQYVKASITTVEAALTSSGQRLPSRYTTPIQANYRPELNTTAELKLEGIRYYQEMIGVLWWAIELGRIDIAMKVSMLSSHLALPREGHLQQGYHIFGFL
jgi:hypothetical protein